MGWKQKLFILACLVFLSSHIHAQSYNADANGDGTVNGADYIIWLNHYGTPSTNGVSVGDFNLDGTINGTDYIIWLNKYGMVVSTATPQPTSPQTSTSAEWVQFAHNAQRTSYSSQGVTTPWKFKWQWNGAGADGKKQSGHLSVPDFVQPITGGNRVYMIAGNSVYALDKTSGNVLWTRSSIGTLSATGVYDNEQLYIPSSDGHIYKLNAQNGSIITSFTGAGSLNQSLLLANGLIIAGSSNGNVYAVNPTNMNQSWVYSAGSPIVSPPAYSSNANVVIINSQDLYVHAVKVSDGTRNWRVKPTSRTYQSGTPSSSGAQFEEGWPVIAEMHGIVFVRYRLDWDTLWTWNPYPTTNAEIKNNLTSRPEVQALFALKLSDGSKAFVPAVGNGGAGDGGTLPMGPQPVVKVINGKEVAYIIWRNGLTCAASWCDGREDATMGEMVLDNTTVSGYTAGDVRFVRFADIQTDEMMNITMGGDVIFHSHWLINAAEKITDRSDSKGSTFTNPITTTDAPFVIWRQCNGTNVCNYPGCTGNSNCGINCAVSNSRYCSNGLYSYGDARSYPAGFYEYNNDMNSGTNPFTVISSGLILVKTNDGGVIALESGNPLSSNNPPLAQQKSANVLGANESTPFSIAPEDAHHYIDQNVQIEGKLVMVEDHLPKAMYLSFTNNHNDSILLRIFNKDVSFFPYQIASLKNKHVKVTGRITLYWPEGKYPEMIITSPNQIKILD